MDAEDYDRWYATPRGRWIGRRETALVLDGLQPRRGESLLDVGCGTGHFTRALGAAIEGDVAAVDIDRAWVDYARRHDERHALYAIADGSALPFADAGFDLVVSIAAICFMDDERTAMRELVRVTRRRFAVGLLNRHSLLWLKKGRNGGSGGYRGARWHTPDEARALFEGLPVRNVRVATAIHAPGGSWPARAAERVLPSWLPTGAFIVVSGDAICGGAAG